MVTSKIQYVKDYKLKKRFPSYRAVAVLPSAVPAFAVSSPSSIIH